MCYKLVLERLTQCFQWTPNNEALFFLVFLMKPFSFHVFLWHHWSVLIFELSVLGFPETLIASSWKSVTISHSHQLGLHLAACNNDYHDNCLIIIFSGFIFSPHNRQSEDWWFGDSAASQGNIPVFPILTVFFQNGYFTSRHQNCVLGGRRVKREGKKAYVSCGYLFPVNSNHSCVTWSTPSCKWAWETKHFFLCLLFATSPNKSRVL